MPGHQNVFSGNFDLESNTCLPDRATGFQNDCETLVRKGG